MRLIEDVRAHAQGSVLKIFSTILINPDFHCVVLYRIAHLFHRLHLGVIAKVFWYLDRVIYAVDIDYRADLAGGFQVVHGIGLVVGAFVKTRGPVMIFQGVTLGGSNDKESVKHGMHLKQPCIGKNTIIYGNSMLAGPLWIGDDVTIGAGSLVMDDIEDGQTYYTKRTDSGTVRTG